MKTKLMGEPAPTMLTLSPLQAVERDLDRRWMTDDFFDLIVWYETGGRLHGFQLCYDKAGDERVFTWTPDGGAQHARIDTGETNPAANHTPILRASQSFPARAIQLEFDVRSTSLPPEMREFVLSKIAAYADTSASPGGKPA